MNTIEPSVHQFLQGDLDLDELSLKLEKFASESPEDTETVLERITQLSRTGQISAVDQSKLENIFKRIKAVRGDSLPMDEEATVLAPASNEESVDTPDLSESSSEPLQVGSVLKDRFTLVEVLGRGGMGVVYKAKDQRRVDAQDRQPFVALKVLSEEFKENPDSFISLQREARKSQQLAHPNVVTVYDFDVDRSHVYMVMECMEGQPLNAVMAQPGFLSKPLKERWSIINQFGKALNYAHKQKIIHSDFKPGNIFYNDRQVVKVLDFGIARAVKDSQQNLGDTTVFDAGDLNCLTPAYASCEMFENKPPDVRDDIYAFGCVAYEVLAGRHPFGKIPANLARNNKTVPERIKGISRKQWKAISHTLEFERESRTPSVEAFFQEIGEATSYAWPLALTLTASISVGGMVWYQPNTTDFGLTPNTPRVIERNRPLTPVEQNKIDKFLEIADVHFDIGRITEPMGSNALFAYRQVLEIDPANLPAKQGVEQIAEHFVIQAREMLDQGNTLDAFKLAEAGLKAVPNHGGLSKLYEETKP